MCRGCPRDRYSPRPRPLMHVQREWERKKTSLSLPVHVIATNFFRGGQEGAAKWHWQFCKWHVSSLPRARATLSNRDSQFPRAGITLAGPISGSGDAMVCGIKTSIKKEIAGGKQERGKEKRDVEGLEGQRRGQSEGGVLKKLRAKEQFSHLADAPFSSFQRRSRWRFSVALKDTPTRHRADGHLGCLHGSGPWTLLPFTDRVKNKVQVPCTPHTLIYTAPSFMSPSLQPPSSGRFHWAPSDWADKAVSSLSWRLHPPRCTLLRLSLLERFLRQIS